MKINKFYKMKPEIQEVLINQNGIVGVKGKRNNLEYHKGAKFTEERLNKINDTPHQLIDRTNGEVYLYSKEYDFTHIWSYRFEEDWQEVTPDYNQFWLKFNEQGIK